MTIEELEKTVAWQQFKIRELTNLLEGYRAKEKPPEVRRIVRLTADVWGVPETALFGSWRPSIPVGEARQAAQLICREHGLGTKRLSAAFGRTYGAINHAQRVAANLVETDRKFRTKLQTLRERVKDL